MMKKIALLLVIPLTLSACVKFGSKPPAQLLTITSAQSVAANEVRTAKAGEAVVIGVPVVPQAIANLRVAVADGPTTIAYVKDAQWVEPPARLFQRLLSDTVAAKTGKVVIDPRQFTLNPGIQLSGQLKSFGLDARKLEAVVIYDAAISRSKDGNVETRRFEAHEPVSAIEAKAAGSAINRAANRVAEEVAAWVAGG